MKTLSITMQINKKNIAIFPDPSLKEYADLINMARGIAVECWYPVELLICEQYGPSPFDVQWKIMQFDKTGEMRKMWEEEADEE